MTLLYILWLIARWIVVNVVRITLVTLRIGLWIAAAICYATLWICLIFPYAALKFAIKSIAR